MQTPVYRLMFNKYGFAYPEVLKKDGFSQKEIGKIDDLHQLDGHFIMQILFKLNKNAF